MDSEQPNGVTGPAEEATPTSPSLQQQHPQQQQPYSAPPPTSPAQPQYPQEGQYPSYGTVPPYPQQPAPPTPQYPSSYPSQYGAPAYPSQQPYGYGASPYPQQPQYGAMPASATPYPYGMPYSAPAPMPQTIFVQNQSFTGKAVAAYLLYFLGFIPGLIVNIMFLNEANRVKRESGGRTPSGYGCLIATLIGAIVPGTLFLIVCWLIVVGIIAAGGGGATAPA